MYITEKQLAELINIELRTIRNWRVRGEGPPFYRFGRSIRYDDQESIDWAKTRRFRSTTQADPHGPKISLSAASTRP